MKNNATIESLKAMRFSAMAAELERQIQDPATYAHMGFEERVALLVDAEWNSRQNNKLTRCIRDARFAEPGAAVEDIEYYEDRRLDKAQLLRFATCDFIAQNHHKGKRLLIPMEIKIYSKDLVRNDCPRHSRK